MISYKRREGKRGRSLKMSKHLERLYKDGKCRDCTVVVTRMDFAKILGKFTKVKIQYESSSSPKTQKTQQGNKPVTNVANTRLKNNENGMVMVHRNAYNPHPAKNLVNTRKHVNNKVASSTINSSNTILKEINILKKTPLKNGNVNYENIKSRVKQYAIVFNDPTSKDNNNNINIELTLSDLLPKVSADILPSEEWCIDYFPKKDEPQNDKVYDRIAAELEDLMYNEKPELSSIKAEPADNKVEEFPSIMDILNDNTTPESNSEQKSQNSNIDLKDSLESNDVEAMLLGKAVKNETPMEVDNTDVNKLIADVAQFSSDNKPITKDEQSEPEFDNPHSPSILDEALQKGIEEHLPYPHLQNKAINKDTTNQNMEIIPKNEVHNNLNIPSTLKLEDVTHVIFKKVVNGKCLKSVTCPRNLKYSIELDEKSVEFLGAPKYISSSDDLQVLLQIVNETDLKRLYVFY
ncbi:uncharacterized protein LOC112048161 [Bicyclus anynana]|uniref:Uncharacterized protein LOC112048161 n=1 Tax=Bicyclus anynana TaxID=110368 RepID=A0ABM3LT56_BICAN|nr:uncharacterized protein LOC112048161 [Bicyclus anynana]